VIIINLGKGFVVTVANETIDIHLIQLFAKRKQNYIVIARLPDPYSPYRAKTYPQTYLVSSLDGDFLHIENMDAIPKGLTIRDATQDDVNQLNA
jgi:hypothetical protein